MIYDCERTAFTIENTKSEITKMAKKEPIASNNNPIEVYQLSETFVSEVRRIIEESRNNAVRSVDYCRVQMYWNIGRRIVEEEQQGNDRADYGSYLIQNLADDLEPEYGSGFSYRQLAFCRQFLCPSPVKEKALYSSGKSSSPRPPAWVRMAS